MTVPTTLVIDATQQTLEVTTSRDAISLRGRDIETGTPTNGEVLTYSTSASEWIYQSVDENVDDRVAALIQDSAGGGLTWTYNDAAGTLTPAYVGDSTLVTCGALNSGSITSGFTSIDVGSGAITTTGTVSATTLAGTLSTAAQTNITSIGTLAAGAVPASLVTAATFGAGAYVFPSTLGVTGVASLNNITNNFGTTSGANTTVNVLGNDATAKILQFGSATDATVASIQGHYNGGSHLLAFYVNGTQEGRFVAGKLQVSNALEVTGDLVVSGTGPHAIGGGNLNYVQMHFTGAFTSSGASTTATGILGNQSITGASGDTGSICAMRLASTLKTQTATESIGYISQLCVEEPNIQDNLTGDITVASTVYIKNAPTEGESNYALLVDDGAVKFDTSLELATGATVTGIDDGGVATGSATLLATQGAIKTYVDAQVTAQDLDIITSSGTIDIDLDSESLTLTGGTGLASSATGTTVTFAIDATVATLSGSQTLTNKSIAGGSNTLSAIANGSLSNSTVAYGGVTLALGASDATPAFNLSDATGYTGDSALVTVGTIGTGLWNASIIQANYGGSGLVGAASGMIAIADGAGAPTTLDVGSSTAITILGTVATGVWSATVVGVAYGGSGLTSYAAGDILYASGSTTLAKLAKGSDTEVLTLASGVPTWAAPTVGDITSVVAGTGLSGGGTSGAVTLNVEASQTQITSVGALGAGSISSGFGAIDVGSSAIDGGTITGTFVGNVTGTASVAALASTVTVAASGGDETSHIAMFDSVSGSLAVKTDPGLTYNATSNALSATTFVGALTGNAATATALATARTIGGTSFDGTANIAVALSATATALATARAINGVNFDGTAAITVTAAAGTLTGGTLNSGVTASSLTSLGTIGSLVATSADINGGTLDGATVGASSASTGAFTTLAASSTLAVTGVSTFSDDVKVAATKKLYLDGGYNTYIVEESADDLHFVTNGTARFTIGAAGRAVHNYGIAPMYPAAGLGSYWATADEYALAIWHNGNATSAVGMAILCGTDDNSGTNTAIRFMNGQGTTQGSITQTSGTVSYNAFTAGHDASLPVGETAYAYGTLVEIVEIYYKQEEGQDMERGILYKVQKSQSAYAKNVLGAYSGQYTESVVDDDNLHQIYCLGDGHILCNGENGDIEVGDGICTSSTEGEGMKADQLSMIIGIAQEDTSFSSASETKLVPVQYGLRQFQPWD